MRISDWSSDVCSSDLLAPRIDTIGFMARDARLLRAIGHALLPARPALVYSRLLIAEDAFRKISVQHRKALQPWMAILARTISKTEQLPLFPSAEDRKSTRLNSSH